MSFQISIFDAPVAPAAARYRPPRGKRLYRITLNNGERHIIETEKSMLEISNELRGKAKVSFHTPGKRETVFVSEEVLYIENAYQYMLDQELRHRRTASRV